MSLKLRTAPFGEEIDKLTRSIENAITGESFPTEVRRLTVAQARKLGKKDWSFNWVKEAGDASREVYQLNTVSNPDVVHGLVSLEFMPDHVYMHLVESAPFNKGRDKLYLGVLGNLAAFACRCAFERGHDGFVAFESKTNLVAHYRETLGADQISSSRLYLGTPAAAKLVERYFPDFFTA